MKTKLTLLVQRLIRRARAYTGRPGVVAQSPAVQSLVGALAGHRLGEADYRAHLVERYRSSPSEGA
jgi:hypothetical protein